MQTQKSRFYTNTYIWYREPRSKQNKNDQTHPLYGGCWESFSSLNFYCPCNLPIFSNNLREKLQSLLVKIDRAWLVKIKTITRRDKMRFDKICEGAVIIGAKETRFVSAASTVSSANKEGSFVPGHFWPRELVSSARFIEAARFDESPKKGDHCHHPIGRESFRAGWKRKSASLCIRLSPLPRLIAPSLRGSAPSNRYRSTAPSFLVCPSLAILFPPPSKPFFQTCLFPRTIGKQSLPRLWSFSEEYCPNISYAILEKLRNHCDNVQYSFEFINS